MINEWEEGISQAIAEPISLSQADENWAREFSNEKQRLLAALPGRFIEIEHFGSTAVPGLLAKPVIDILAGLSTLEDADRLIEPLRALRYHYPLEFNRTLLEHRWFMRQHHGKRSHHLHLVVYGGERWKRELGFRDILRSDPEVAAQYARLKGQLAGVHLNDRERYTDAKADFIANALRTNA